MALSGSETTQLSTIALPGKPHAFVAKTALALVIVPNFIVAESAATFIVIADNHTLAVPFEEATFYTRSDPATFYALALSKRPI